MGSRKHLSSVVLLLGIVSVSMANTLFVASRQDEQESTEIRETLSDIQQRLVHLERTVGKQYETINVQLKALEQALNENSRDSERNAIVRDLISAINRGHFRIAEEKLLQLGESAPISDIVHEVYAGSERNFGLLVNLTRSLTKKGMCTYGILSTLYEEMNKNGHKDIKNLITLSKAFESEILNQVNNPDDDVKSTADDIVEELMEAITSSASEFLIAAMESKQLYMYNEGVAAIGAALADYRPGVAGAVMERTVEAAYKTVDHEKILEAVTSHADLWQKIAGMNALFRQLETVGPWQGPIVVTIAWHLSKILSQTEYATLDSTMKTTAEVLFASLPASARNLFSLPSFCIYNKLQDSYLLASATSFYGSERRDVFISPRSENGTLPKGTSWRVKLLNKKLFFDNVDFPGENIYAALYEYVAETHYVFGWIPRGNTDLQSAWNLEFDGENWFFRNDHFPEEYLYASDTVHQVTGYKYAFSKRMKSSASNLPFIWQITDCSHSFRLMCISC